MKKLLKILLSLILILFLGLFIAYMLMNENLPEGKDGPEAEALAQKMLLATNKAAWDTTHIIRFSFRGEHQHLWDKKNHLAQTEWEAYRTVYDVNTAKGKAWENGIEITDPGQADEIIRTAWGFFLNDSYWLNPVAKIYDKGVTRKSLTLEDGSKGLLVTHGDGGITPGDSYLWILNEKGLPKAWKMWVNIIPLGGLETSWEDWTQLSTGAMVARKHQLEIGGLGIPIGDLKAAGTWAELGEENPFTVLD